MAATGWQIQMGMAGSFVSTIRLGPSGIAGKKTSQWLGEEKEIAAVEDRCEMPGLGVLILLLPSRLSFRVDASQSRL